LLFQLKRLIYMKKSEFEEIKKRHVERNYTCPQNFEDMSDLISIGEMILTFLESMDKTIANAESKKGG